MQETPTMTTPCIGTTSSLIINIPPRVLDELCRCIDCLLDWEWLQFVSNIISDETTVQRFSMKRRAGDNATRELLWSWGQKLATVQDLEQILDKLQLYRARDILRQSYLAASPRDTQGSKGHLVHGSGPEQNSLGHNAVKENASGFVQPLPSPPPPPSEILKSLDSDCAPSSSTDEVLSIPQQEISLTPGSLCQQWTPQQLDEITDRFSIDKKIYSGEYADIYVGQVAGRAYAIKRMHEMDKEQTDRLNTFFQTEAHITFRCNHPNLLPLLGFCLESRHRCLISQFMKNGSLHEWLHGVRPHALNWEKRLIVATGLLQAVHHLHAANLFHGNIKSTNVFLDENFTPKLGHSGPRFRPDTSGSYTQVKTQDLQKYQPYVPDSYLRRGQLTAQIDIFSAGVVLAEILMGLKPTDKNQDPAYLKDLVLKEMEKAKMCAESNQSEAVEHLCAKAMFEKHADKKPGRPPPKTGFYLALAVCLCLTKKKVILSEVTAMIEKAENELKVSLKESRAKMSSMNIPEESDFKELLSPWPSKTSGALHSMNLMVQSDLEGREISVRSPCELDEPFHSAQPETAGHCSNLDFPDLNHPSESDDPSWGIKVNMAKMKLITDIELYEQEKVDSSVLFSE